MGRQGGFVAADVLAGADIARIPIHDVQDLVPPYLSVNTTVLEGLREPWRVPGDVLTEANVVVDDRGIRRKAAPAPGGAGSSNKPPLTN